MIPHNRNLFVIVVHFGEQEPTKNLVFGLTQCRKSPDVLLIVNQEAAPFPDLGTQNTYYVQHPENGGYAAGVNAGIQQLYKRGVRDDDIVVILNNDIEVTGQPCSAIRSWWSGISDDVLAGPWLGSVNLMTGRAHIGEATRVWHTQQYLHGACMAAQIRTLRRIGSMPEEYGMYWEDVAWSVQAVASGASIQHMEDIGFTHNHTRETSGRRTYYQVRNGAYWLEHSLSPAWRWYWRLRDNIRRLYHCRMRPGTVARTVCRALKDAKIGKLGL